MMKQYCLKSSLQSKTLFNIAN